MAESYLDGGIMRPFNTFICAFLLIGGCGGDPFDSAGLFPETDAASDDPASADHANGGSGGQAGSGGSSGSAGNAGKAGHAGIAGAAGVGGEPTDAREDADAARDAEIDVGSDAKDSGAGDVVTTLDAKDADVPDSDADAYVDTECEVTGIRVRMDAVNGKTIVKANAALGDPSSFMDGACTASDDSDPSHSSFDCCLRFESSGVEKIWLDFVFSDNTHACLSTSAGCSPLTQYTIWFNGTQVPLSYLSNNYLPNCMSAGCQWYVYTGP